MHYWRVRGGIITVSKSKGSAPTGWMAFVISGMQFWEANELSHRTSPVPTATFCMLSAPAHIIWSTSAHLGGCQMRVEQKEPRKASQAKWKSITPKPTSFSLQRWKAKSNQWLFKSILELLQPFGFLFICLQCIFPSVITKKSNRFHKPMYFMVQPG